jgi:very-short-patch-repair endonuclease
VAGAVAAEPPGVCAHRTTVRRAGDVGKLRAVPVTNPVVTLVDLAAVLPEEEVDSALHAAVTTGSVDARRIHEHLRRRGGHGRRGVGVMRKILSVNGRASHVSSPLEHALAAVLCTGDLPTFVREHPVRAGGAVYYLDFAYPQHRVGVEAEGWRWHSDTGAFERDRVRHNALAAAGWRILRVTDKHIRSCPELVRSQVIELVGLNVGIRA